MEEENCHNISYMGDKVISLNINWMMTKMRKKTWKSVNTPMYEKEKFLDIFIDDEVREICFQV